MGANDIVKIAHPIRSLDGDHSQGFRTKPKLVVSIPYHSPVYAAQSDFFGAFDSNIEWCPQEGSWKQNDDRNVNGPLDLLVKSRWADLLFVVATPHFISKMLAGDTESDIHGIMRSWDTSKPILLIPQMSIDDWNNPITKRQLGKIRNQMPWITCLDPVLWDIPCGAGLGVTWEHAVWEWKGKDVALKTFWKMATTGRRPDHRAPNVHQLVKGYSKLPSPRLYAKNILPPELLTIIFDFVGDWELAQTVGIFTNLPTPPEWISHLPNDNKAGSLEYTILTCSLSHIRTAFSSTKPKSLSDLATKIIFKFSMTQLLTYLSFEQKDIFWTSFGLTLLPHRASVQFNKPAILEWWCRSPAIIKRDYGPEAVDGASRMGFVSVLDWWLNSGLPLLYTERALESASSKGHVEVLEWWKQAADMRSKSDSPIKLKVGKSILAAAQCGRSEALEWWDKSGILYGHEEGVARLASANGHVDTLRKWSDLKGGKMVFDNQVLVGATKNGHADVLEWWKQSGMRVEYKTCDIEEAMEDSSVGGDREDQVRLWWERNGLNLGVGTNEWMKVKCLQVD